MQFYQNLQNSLNSRKQKIGKNQQGSWPDWPVLLRTVCCFVLIMGFPTRSATSCDPTGVSFQGYSFLNPAITRLKSPFAPFTLGFKEVFQYYMGKKVVQEQENIRNGGSATVRSPTNRISITSSMAPPGESWKS